MVLPRKMTNITIYTVRQHNCLQADTRTYPLCVPQYESFNFRSGNGN